ncbi:hypothetical protein IJ670_02290 [bacterium]|nr:hypothetical protein [bacterium]
MRIAAINTNFGFQNKKLNKSSNVNFKGQKNEVNPNKSLQNNSPDIMPSPYIKSHLMQKDVNTYLLNNFLTIDEDGQMTVDEDFQNYAENMLQSNSQMILGSIKLSLSFLAGYYLSSVPQEKLNSIPEFISVTLDDYLEKLNQNKAIMMNNLAEQYSSVLSQLQEDEDFSSEDMAEFMAQGQEVMDYMSNFSDTLSHQDRVEFNEIFKNLSKGMNYMYSSALEEGFRGNARGVIDELSKHDIYGEPASVVNSNGIIMTKQISSSKESVLTIWRNAQNGDFIAFAIQQKGKTPYKCQFNKDGSIKKMEIENDFSKEKITIRQYPSSQEISVSKMKKGYYQNSIYGYENGKFKLIAQE